jgi:Tol biopolymer transport system component
MAGLILSVVTLQRVTGYMAFLIIVVLGTINVHAQTSWTKPSSNPALPNGSSGTWDQNEAHYPSVIWDGGIYKMWYAGYNGSSQSIGYATSTDGINWTKHSGNPVISPSEAWEGSQLVLPEVIKHDGIYKMWYQNVGTPRHIGYATSSDGISWTKHSGNPVINAGASGEWDDDQIGPGTVIVDNGVYKMWYSGFDGSQLGIGYATSTDGINWTKNSGNPLFSTLVSWLPSVLKQGASYHMWYSYTPSGGNDSIGYATSNDGLQWTDWTGNPVLAKGSSGSWDATGIQAPTVILDGSTFKMWYHGLGGGIQQIGYATSPASLPDLQISGKIVFEALRDGNSEIYTMNVDGTEQTRITNNSAADLLPYWSPDGTKIAFDSDRDGDREIYVMNADGTGETRLTNSSGADIFPSWSPDGLKIAFRSDRDGNGEIYVMNADGTGETRLTNNSGNDDNPTWSPDGTKITFKSNVDGNPEIYVMNVDGSSQARLTNNSVEDNYPEWSPDGTKIAFWSDRDGNEEVYVMNADGSGQTRLTNQTGADVYPSWSADGTKIVFTSFRDGNGEIYVMNVDGTGQVRLTNDSALDEQTSWGEAVRHIGSSDVGTSASRTITIENGGSSDLSVTNITSSDGQFTLSPTNFSVISGASQDVTITFTPTSTGTKYSTLTISSDDPDAGTLNFIVNGIGTQPPVPELALSSNSLALGNVDKHTSGSSSFTVTNSGGGTLSISNITSSNSQFAVSPTNFDLSGGANQMVTVTLTPTAVGWEQSTLTITHNASGNSSAVTASGIGRVTPQTGSLTDTRITFMSARDSGNLEIYTMNSDGSDQTRITDNPAQDSAPTWTSDGSKIAFLSDRDGNNEIYSMNADGTNVIRLTNNASVDTQPAWSGDGTKIAFFSIRDGNPEIYVMNADGSNQTRLTNSSDLDVEPDWSPDDSKIVFRSQRDGNPEIYVMDVDGSNQTRITNAAEDDDSPAWSPDGTKIAYFKGGDGGEVYVMDADGSNPTRLTNSTGANTQPSWSPDGTEIVFRSSRDSGVGDEIYVMDADGSNPTRLTNNADNDDSPEWSPFIQPAPGLSLSSTSLAFGNVNTGASGTQTLTVSNTGSATLSVTGISITGTDASQFSVSPTTLSVNAGQSQNVTVTFSPTAKDSKSASLSITHNAAGSPSSVSLTGTGIDTTPPAAPSGVGISYQGSQPVLQWTANSENDLSHYVVYRSITDGFSPASGDSVARVDPPGVTYTDIGLGADMTCPH